MSFSKDVKEELAKQVSGARHCRIAEIAAIIGISGRVVELGKQKIFLKVVTENLTVAKKYYILIKKTFDIQIEIIVKRKKKGNSTYSIYVNRRRDAETILKAVKRMDDGGSLKSSEAIVNGLVIQSLCCKRAFIRGVFLACGSVADPSKSYHFEMVLADEQKATSLCRILQSFDIDAKIILRKKAYVVYIKEGEQIVELLNVMEAHVALMNLENVRILKEVRNSVNRQVNCETANIHKTVLAASKHINDILYIRDSVGFGGLSDGLREMAELRIEHSEASLKELGSLLNPSIGKSGVNHRLRKLSEMAERLRGQKED
jgi:DNA-binding protein WhiA